ncbi:hypothetical protein NDU88_006079 [Pleurodeles waltl]|uniref:Uncharacterized protein n=1 Tax=Pleurodeles waltl TaxID=8319 RepID=A0AAV7QK60_PLEWA|nr:hypothetical protein NDU88_006079 [Pleurodeles waltl]
MWHLHSVHLSLCPPGLRSIRVQIKSKKGLFRFGCERQIWAQQVPGRPAAPHRSPGRSFGSSGPCAHRFGAGLSGQSPPHQQGISAVLKMAAAILDRSRLCSVQNIGLKSRSLGLKALPQRCRWTLCIFGPTASWFEWAQAGQDLPGRGEKDGSLTERLLPSPSFFS